MEISEGLLYHIKDTFFFGFSDCALLENKEGKKKRPHFLLFKDRRHDKLWWVIPLSSKVEKYRNLRDYKIKKYGMCNTIVTGQTEGDRESAFLLQNMFPITAEYIDHVHTINNTPVQIHDGLKKQIISYANQLVNAYYSGHKIMFTDVDKIISVLSK